jgi:hypothetical protein
MGIFDFLTNNPVLQNVANVATGKTPVVPTVAKPAASMSYAAPVPAPKVQNMSYANSSPAPVNMSVAPKVSTPVYPTPNGKPIAPTISTANQAIKSTPDGTTYHAPVSNPSVLAQQQALNKLGAGLVEDGISGAKTQAALEKYGSQLYGTSGGSTTDTTGSPTLPPAPTVDTTSPADLTAINARIASDTADVTKNSQLSPEEIAATKAINDYTASYNAGTNQNLDKTIPLEFITGQNASLERRYNAGVVPLQNDAALAQAKRTAALSASKAALDQENTNRGFIKDSYTSVPYGASLYNTATKESVGGVSSDDQALIGKALADGKITTADITRYGMPSLIQALKADPSYSAVSIKAGNAADQSSLVTNQGYLDTTTRAYNTATANLGTLTSFMTKYGINDSNTPVINQLNNKVKAGLTDPGAIAAFKSSLEGLRSEYAQVLSRGGTVTDTSRNQANSLIPDDLSPAQLAIVTSQLSKEGTNAIKEAQGNVDVIKKRLAAPKSTNLGSSSSSSGGGSSVGWF